MTFTNKKKPIQQPTLFMNDTPLNEVNMHNHLGLTFSSDLTWTNHIRNIVSRASQRVNIMKRLKYLLGRKSLMLVYKTMIRPIMEYACIIFDNCNANDRDLLESVQYDAARVCLGALCNTSKTKLLDELGWDGLSERRRYYKLIAFYKIMNNLT